VTFFGSGIIGTPQSFVYTVDAAVSMPFCDRVGCCNV
jgi:hypothetical protein